MFQTGLFDNGTVRDSPEFGVWGGKGKICRESLSPNLFSRAGTCDPVVVRRERSVCSVVSNICCWPIFDAVEKESNQPTDGVLFPFAS